MNGKKMPAHSIEMPDGRTLAEHLQEHQNELKGQITDLDQLEADILKLFVKQDHQQVHMGGHLASHIPSDADLAKDPATDLRLEDYLQEVMTARGPYKRLATNLSAWTGKPVVRRWQRLKDYRRETLFNLDPITVYNSLVLAKLFKQEAAVVQLFDKTSLDGAYDTDGTFLRLGKLPDGTYWGRATYQTDPITISGGVDMRSVGIIDWNQLGEGISVQIKTASSLDSRNPENLAGSRAVTTNFIPRPPAQHEPYPTNPNLVTDGTLNDPLYPLTAAGATTDGDWPWVMIDLGFPLDVNHINVKHGWDPRGWPYTTNYGWRVYDSVLEVSATGEDDDWHVLWGAAPPPGQPAPWYYENPYGKDHVFPTRKVRYIRDKCRQGQWVEIAAYGPSLDEVPWTSVQARHNLFADPAHGGHKYYQLKIGLTGQNPSSDSYQQTLPYLTPQEGSTDVVVDAAGLHLESGVAYGTWLSDAYEVTRDNVELDGFVSTGAVGPGVSWQYRLGSKSPTNQVTWGPWARAADGHGLHPLTGDMGQNLIQFRVTLQRLYATDPSPTITGIDLTYRATTYTATPSITNLRMSSFVQYYAKDGSITALVDTETTGTHFDYLRWTSTLVEDTGLSVEARTSDTYPFDDTTQLFQPIYASGDPIPLMGRYIELKLTLSSATGMATSQINGFELKYLLDRQFESNRDLVELTGDMVRTAFELKRKTLYNQQSLRRVLVDAFEDFSGVDPNSTYVGFDPDTRSVYPDGNFEATVISTPFRLSATALMFLAAATLGDDGMVRAYYATFPDETSLVMNEADWIEIGQNEQKLVLDTPLTDQVVRLKIAVAGSARLYSWGLAYWQ